MCIHTHTYTYMLTHQARGHSNKRSHQSRSRTGRRNSGSSSGTCWDRLPSPDAFPFWQPICGDLIK